VSVWARDVKVVYPPSILGNTHISFIEHRKSMRAAEHEYILLTVIYHDNGPHIRYVRIDRRPFKRIDTRIILFLGMGVVANDTISMSTTPFDATQTYSLYNINFDINEVQCPNMLDLITILTIVPSLAPRYHLYTSCCYWFSRMVFESLAHISRGKVLPADRPQYRGRFAGHFVVVDESGSFLLRKPRAVRRWENFHSSISYPGYARAKSTQSSPLSQEYLDLLDYLFYVQLQCTELNTTL